MSLGVFLVSFFTRNMHSRDPRSRWPRRILHVRTADLHAKALMCSLQLKDQARPWVKELGEQLVYSSLRDEATVRSLNPLDSNCLQGNPWDSCKATEKIWEWRWAGGILAWPGFSRIDCCMHDEDQSAWIKLKSISLIAIGIYMHAEMIQCSLYVEYLKAIGLYLR